MMNAMPGFAMRRRQFHCQSPRSAGFVLVVTVVAALTGGPALAVTTLPLASYEPAETDLTLTPHPGDTGLSVTIVPGNTSGAPPATDGGFVLKVSFTGEDGKVEFSHDWAATTYDLSGYDELLADVYIATASAVPGIMGIWSPNWNPPDAWQPAGGLPGTTGVWTTIAFDVSGRSQIGLDRIAAFIFEDMPGADGTAYVDNLRLRNSAIAAPPGNLIATAFEERVELVWDAVIDAGLEGYIVYRSEALEGPFGQVNDLPVAAAAFSDEVGSAYPTLYYYITSVIDGEESDPSPVVEASFNGVSDAELLTAVQEATFRYFWDFAHPVSGLTREGFTHPADTCASGGTGMGLMAIAVGVERGFVTRAEASARVLQMLTFLGDTAERFHGAWPHWIHGVTGAALPFGPRDNGGDLVETAYLVQGLLTVRQYFDADEPVEQEIRTRATQMWEEVEWDWYRRYPDSDVLYWHWSPDYGWDMNMTVTGYNEAMITYLLAIASPTNPMPPSSYYNGWAGNPGYANGNTYYGFRQWVGPQVGGPLFFTHYSFLGFDPRYKRDVYCNYFENSRNISLIHQAYSIDNPHGFAGYSALVWGLTASTSPPPWGYKAHCPTDDVGTITPSAALGATPFTPQESVATIRHLCDTYGPALFGEYGFYDAFNLDVGWVSDTYLAIDQGPIIVMIENQRTQLCWNLFMANPEIRPMLRAIGWHFEGDLDLDGDIDLDDHLGFTDCLAGPGASAVPPGCLEAEFLDVDLDGDNDVDLRDFAIFETLFHAP